VKTSLSLASPLSTRKLDATDHEIKGQQSAIADAKGRIDSVKDEDDPESVREREKAGQALQEAGEALEALIALR